MNNTNLFGDEIKPAKANDIQRPLEQLVSGKIVFDSTKFDVHEKLQKLIRFEKEVCREMFYQEIRQAFEGRLCFQNAETLIDVIKQQLEDNKQLLQSSTLKTEAICVPRESSHSIALKFR